MDKKNNQNDNPNKKKNIKSAIILLVVCLGITALFTSVMSRYKNGSQKKISYSKFLTMLDKGEIKKVQVADRKIYIEPKTQQNPLMKTTYYTVSMNDALLVNRLKEAEDNNKISSYEQQDSSGSNAILSVMVSYVLPFVLIYAMMYFVMRGIGKGGGMMGSVGKSNAKVYVEKKTGVTFADVAGQDEAKESLTEMVDFLHNPQKYQEIGAVCPKGALLVGPPGTGKTLLAKAVAGEAGVPFFSISGSEFVEMFVGMGASKVRDLFKQANEKAPCIVFIDEIDTIGKKRDSHGMAGNDEREQTLNQLLTEMDGFDASKGVVILAATNRPDTLDPALLRPGRFDRRIPVELPDLKGREEILKVHARKIKLGDNVDFNAIARAASGASGAELANMVNEAALRAVRENRKFVVQSDLEESIEVVIAGYQKKNRVLSTKEKLIVAYHEIGHALVAALQTHSAPVTKITIIPRTSGALGYTMQVEEEERNLMTEEELKNKIATLTGGRCAEELVFGSVTTGASNDIEQATKLSRAMITRYGMSSRFGMVALETQSNPYLGGDSSLSCSPETAATIDDMVVDMVKQSYEKARKLLKDNQGKLHELAKYLYEKETITGDEFMRILSQKELSSDGETASGAEFAADGRQILEEEKASDKEVHISEE